MDATLDGAARSVNKWHPITLKTLYPLPMKAVRPPQIPEMKKEGGFPKTVEVQEKMDKKREENNHPIGSPTLLNDRPHQFKLDLPCTEEERRCDRSLKYRTVLRSHLFTKASVSVEDGALIAKGVSVRGNIHPRKNTDGEEELCQNNELQCTTQQIRSPKQSVSFSIPPVIVSIDLHDEAGDKGQTAPPKSAFTASRTIRSAQQHVQRQFADPFKLAKLHMQESHQFSVAHSINERNTVDKQQSKRASMGQKHVLQILYEKTN